MSISCLAIGAIVTFAFTSTSSPVWAGHNETGNQKQKESESKESLYPLPMRNLNDLFRETFIETSGTFYDDRSLGRQFNVLFGTGKGYPEEQLANYGKAVNHLYEQYRSQRMSPPHMRGRDLDNPFDTSLGSPDFPDFPNNP